VIIVESLVMKKRIAIIKEMLKLRNNKIIIAVIIHKIKTVILVEKVDTLQKIAQQRRMEMQAGVINRVTWQYQIKLLKTRIL